MKKATEIAMDRLIFRMWATLGVGTEELIGSQRRPEAVLARSVVSRVAHEAMGMSYPEIARAIGRPGHTSVLAAHKRLDRRMMKVPVEMVDVGAGPVPLSQWVTALESEWRDVVLPAVGPGPGRSKGWQWESAASSVAEPPLGGIATRRPGDDHVPKKRPIVDRGVSDRDAALYGRRVPHHGVRVAELDRGGGVPAG